MTTESNNIERNSGTIVGGYRVGGGYRGKREDQDEAVMEFAERLSQEFPHEIDVRYNTNRLGGGAWLKDGRRNAQVGLGAELKPPEWHREQFKDYLDGDSEKPTKPSRMDPDELNLVYTVHLVVPAIDESQTNRETSFQRKNDYAHIEFHSIDAAWNWFMENLNRDNVNPPA